MSGNIVPGQKRPLSLREGRATPAFGFRSRLPPCSALQTPALNGRFESQARLSSSPFEPVPAGTAGGPFRREALVPCQQKKTFPRSETGSLLPIGVWRGPGETNPLRGWAGSSTPAEREGRDPRAACLGRWVSRPRGCCTAETRGWGAVTRSITCAPHCSIPQQHNAPAWVGGRSTAWQGRGPRGTSQGAVPRQSKGFHRAAGMEPGSTYPSPQHLNSPAIKQDMVLSSVHNSWLN